MSASAGGWFVILLALACANLPFINQRLFAIVPLRRARKPIWIRLAELIVCYAVVGAVGFAVEASLGNAFPQGWQFYAITACMMLVFAFPGYTWQYLVKHRGA
jgi:Na+(H+)/acetate symporter ActP